MSRDDDDNMPVMRLLSANQLRGMSDRLEVISLFLETDSLGFSMELVILEDHHSSDDILV